MKVGRRKDNKTFRSSHSRSTSGGDLSMFFSCPRSSGDVQKKQEENHRVLTDGILKGCGSLFASSI